jgi:hypothetical protein
MPHTIPPFPEIGGVRFPGGLSSVHATPLERIHKELRAAVSHSSDRFEQLVCEAVQQCYDMLKQIYAGMGALNRYVLEEALPKKALEIALECGWLPEAARADNPDWRDWSRQLSAGRFSRVGLDDSCKPDPYLFVPFPIAASGDRTTDVQVVAEHPKTEPTGGKRVKPGPKAQTENARQVAEIVARIADGQRWQDKLDEICEALDEAKLPRPKPWRKKSINSWSDATDAADNRGLAKKAIGHHLKNARKL